jgi:peptide/nickel transport system substrate-binding protein
MDARIPRRLFLLLALSAGAVPLAQACAPQAPAQKPAEAPKVAATVGPAATTPPQPTAVGKPAAEAKPTAEPKPAAAKPVEGQPKRGGQLVQASNWTYPTLDPHLTTIITNIGYEALYDGLVKFELVSPSTWEHKVVGSLAESWEQPDPQTAIFKLRRGVTFHDGSEFTAEVAAWNVLRLRDHEKSQKKEQLRVVESAEAVDKHTLRVRLNIPYAPFLRSLAYVSGAHVPMMSKAHFDKVGEEAFARNPSGTGPFKLKQWITDDRLILEKNHNYFENGADGKPLPYLDEFVARFVPDPTVSLVDLQAGTLHLLDQVPAKDVPTIRADPNLVLHELPWSGQIYFTVSFNTEAPPFDDVRVRRAAVQAIDREGMARALGFGVGAPHHYPLWAPGSLGWDEGIATNAYQPARVKELLTEAGHPNGVDVELKVIAREPENTIGEFAQQMWSSVGIKTKLVTLERLAWIDEVRAKKFQACFWRGGFTTSVDPDLAASSIKCGGPANWGQWCDKDIDRLMEQGAAIPDPKQRHEMYRQVLQLIQERAYLGTGIVMPLLTASRKDVQGLTFNFWPASVQYAWLS